MSLRPAWVDAQGGPITGNGGGPMPLAKPAVNWSHLAGKRQRVATDRYSRPIVTFGQPNTNLPCGLMTTITFLGEQQDIIDPEAAVLVAGQTTERRCSVRHPPVDSDLSDHTHQVTRRDLPCRGTAPSGHPDNGRPLASSGYPRNAVAESALDPGEAGGLTAMAWVLGGERPRVGGPMTSRADIAGRSTPVTGEVFGDPIIGWPKRAFLRAGGLSREEVRRRPVIGICSSWSELTPCNMGLRDLAESVRRGVTAAGGTAVVFPTISLARAVRRADDDAAAEPDGDGCRGDDPLQPYRWGGPAGRLRQDRPCPVDGRGQRRQARDHGDRRPPRRRQVPGQARCDR